MIWVWALLRYVLIVSTAAALAGMFYLIIVSPVPLKPLWPAFVIPIGLLLNLVFLIYADANLATKPMTRIGRLFDLWLDAKEADLRKRAGKNLN